MRACLAQREAVRHTNTHYSRCAKTRQTALINALLTYWSAWLRFWFHTLNYG